MRRPSTSYRCCLQKLPGARYFVRVADGEPLAVLDFGAATWKIAHQDKIVGTAALPPTVTKACLGFGTSRPSLW